MLKPSYFNPDSPEGCYDVEGCDIKIVSPCLLLLIYCFVESIFGTHIPHFIFIALMRRT